MPLRTPFLLCISVCAIAADETAAKIDQIFASWNKPDSPGASVAVIRDGKLAFQKGYGIANLEYDIPITPATVFHVASVSKQFTAMAIVLLEQDRKLSLEDDIRKYLPEMPDYGQPVTIRNLLQHTGGIRDQWQTLALADWRLDDVITQKQILRMLARQKELNFPPGTEHLYSNGGYTLAAEIVERVSGKPFPEFCDERIFRPLGMSRTHFHQDHKRIVRDRAYSYTKVQAGFEASPLNYANAGATSLFTTAPDLAVWLDNFRDPKVGGRAGVERLQEQAVLANGKKIDYALGVSTGRYRGLKTISHAGGDAGYRSYVTWFPDYQLGVVVLSNSAEFNPGGTANKVAAVFLGDKMEPEKAEVKVERKFIAIDPATLNRYAGEYRLDIGVILQVFEKGGKLYAKPPDEADLELKPLAPDQFLFEPADIGFNFVPGGDGKILLDVVQNGETMHGKPVVPLKLTAEELGRYAGRYWSEELETQYTLFVRDGKLLAGNAHHIEIPLTPAGTDEFQGSQWFFQKVTFARNSAGAVTGMTVGGGRVKGVKFERR